MNLEPVEVGPVDVRPELIPTSFLLPTQWLAPDPMVDANFLMVFADPNSKVAGPPTLKLSFPIPAWLLMTPALKLPMPISAR